MKIRFFLGSLVFSVMMLVSVSSSTLAQGFPNKPMRIIVNAPAGGPSDILARLIGQKLTENLGQPVVIDNRAGAGGVIGTEAVATAAPDGYTLLIPNTSHTINPSLYSKLPYDPVKDFAPVTMIVVQPFIILVHPSVPAKSVQELIALAKSKPGQINYASAGIGLASHLAVEVFKSMAGINMTHIPYKGQAPATTDLLGGQVSVLFGAIPVALPHVKSGKLRALAITSSRRSPAMPDLPTVAESGLPGYEVMSWYGFLAPAKTPKEIVAKLYVEITKALRAPDVAERITAMGFEPVGSSPEQFAAQIKEEIPKWAKVVKECGARAD